ncbi:DNA/RNA non-specific endonuclease [Gelidibacter sp.]|uniref:DNA/RNA non-specific endonuclease n=1 Tax=Gelidibacter sp. TaxID=2018083 RepID=UPI002B550662|nr:DNA/RNA non-specific endonuclease [Gelidibacter sp.]HUH28103.1 DNA/RNA non-specific endonuclease [Gelidibacter sp.]
MSKRNVYSLIAILLVLGVYGYEYFLKEKEVSGYVKEGERVKPDTRAFFLPASTTGQVIHHQGYSLSYSEPHEQAEWVAYELNRSHLSKSNYKRPYFEIDHAVKTGAASWRNYKNSGYDRGHLVPAGDRTYDKEAYEETFLTSNISPQDRDFNAGIWNTLEQQVRYWAKKYDGVFVVTGGVLKGNLKTIGNEKVAVPEQFYKIVYDPDNQKMIAFLMPNKDSKEPLYNFVVSVDSIEVLTGIDFFPELEDELEDKLEAMDSYRNWGLN